VTSELRAKREAIVREHMATENQHDFAATVRTFATPRYEVVPTGESHDGAAKVETFLRETHGAFPECTSTSSRSTTPTMR
jgi:hypothetical protein